MASNQPAVLAVSCSVGLGLGVFSADKVRADDAAESPPVGAIDAMIAAVLAHHGPGTSGGGSSTISGETLKAGTWSLDLREDYTRFDRVGREEAEARAAAAGEFDAVLQSFVTTVSLTRGITDDFQLGVQLGYYRADDFISADRGEDGSVESGEADPSGITDTWINAKWRVLRGPIGSVSVVGGIKIPSGRDHVRLDNGGFLEPSSQPGSGAIDYQVGAAWSRFLTSQLTIDASAAYTFRSRHDDFKVGDRLDLGAALAWRLSESIDEFPQWSAFVETTAVFVQKDEPPEGENPNTGGTTMFLAPGLRVRFDQATALTIAPSFPVYQDLNGDQDKTKFKIAATLSFSF